MFEVKRRRPRIEIVPMIDVITFLLVFFFLFSTLKQGQTGIEVNLPKTAYSGAQEQNLVVISIDGNSELYYGKNPVTLARLKEKVKADLSKEAQTRFIIKPDGAVPYREIIRVTDILAGEGVNKPLWGVDRRQIPKSTP